MNRESSMIDGWLMSIPLIIKYMIHLLKLCSNAGTDKQKKTWRELDSPNPGEDLVKHIGIDRQSKRSGRV